MVPIQVILLIMTVMFQSPELAIGPTTRAAEKPGLLALTILGSFLAVLLIVGQRTAAATRRLLNTTDDANPILYRTERLLSLGRWATILLTATHIFALGWGQVITNLVNARPFLQHVPMAAQLALLLPPLLTWIIMWAMLYRVERAVHDRSMPYRLAQGLPVHQMPSLGQYLSMQVRHNFYMLVPIVLATALERLLHYLTQTYSPAFADLSSLVAVAIMLMIVPTLIVKMWSTVPLVGDLRERLVALAQTYRLGYRNILLWRTHSHVTNAAILGYLPFARYFLLTDALLETLTDRQIEAVFAHEVGHGVKRHIWWYVASVVGWMMLAAAVINIVGMFAPATLPTWLGAISYNQLAPLLLLALMALFMALLFPIISRRFEHQADWFAAQHMARSVADTPVSAVAAPVLTLDQYISGAHTQPPANPLLAGAEVFNSALDRIVELSHRSRSKKGMMHPSINQRMQLLRTLAVDESARARFEKRQRKLRWLIAAIFLVGTATAIWTELQPPKPAAAPTQPATSVFH